jgi:mannose-6-phosphate isomerase
MISNEGTGRGMQRLRNPIQRFAWGSRSVIARLQARPVPSPDPEAELWVGAHPAAPSIIESSGTSLTEAIMAAPAELLSEPVARRFGHRLPYLLKLLAAAAPLSLQAHPDQAWAAAGYAAEEAAGVPRDAPDRRYVDPYHKPELLVAVSEFRLLCGFREPVVSAGVLAGLGVPALAPVVRSLRAGDLAGAVEWLLTGGCGGPLEVAEVVAAAAARPGYQLVGELADGYPRDRGVVVALLLNQVTLAPGEAIFLPAGHLHGYLHGTGVELMAASDNVLRGGLTPKYVDVPELLRVLRFEPLPDPVRRPVPVAAGVVTWPVPVPELALHRVRLDAGVRSAELALPGPRVVLVLAGEVRVDDRAAPVTLRAGEAAFGAACRPDRDRGGTPGGLGSVSFSGSGEAFVATVGERLFQEMA